MYGANNRPGPGRRTPAGGVEGVGWQLGADLHRLAGPAPTPGQIRDGLLRLADGAGRLIGSFQAGVNGGTPPAGPVLPPAQQVSTPSCCPATPGGTIPAGAGVQVHRQRKQQFDEPLPRTTMRTRRI